MTAEIAIMNKEAIAVAADSAVTLTGREGQKIFLSANKIFALSKYHPVGIMVFGNANIMEVPWETIIKIYRKKLGKKSFNTLEEYASNFINFLNKENQFFPEFVQEKYFLLHIRSYFLGIREEIEKKVKEIISEKKQISKKETNEIISKIIKRHHNVWKNTKLLPSIPEDHIEKLIEKYQDIIEKVKKEIFEKVLINKTLSRQLTEIGASFFAKSPEEIIIPDQSGIVVAGFGTKNLFPSLQSFAVEGMVNNCLKYKKVGDAKITVQDNAEILAFAQREMVHAFMEGVESNYQQVIEDDLSKIFEEYPEIIVDNLEKLDDSEKSDLKEKLKKISNSMLNQYKKKLQNYRRKNYVNPVMKVVAMLPKDELAAMAESLVNLTSFKRKISMGAETVAGPIDVAVISKGDGFIWIKRKHYFKSELNPQFFENYYKEVEYGEKK